jgi:anti-sigma28 factor (negative regulator of flagellin synthesis)
MQKYFAARLSGTRLTADMSFSQKVGVFGMRIYDVNLTGSSAAESSRAQETQRSDRAGGTRTAGAGASGSSDRVEFSSALSRLSQALSTDGSARAGRIQALAAQYQSGSYRTDSLATSKGIVADALAPGAQ